MSPKTKEAVRPEPTEPQDVTEITAERFPEWHALASEAMDEVESGDVERWP